MGLLLIPRAATGGTQPGNRFAEVFHRTHAPKLAEQTREYTEFFGFVFGLEPYSLIAMSDKLTEIMAWKRQEIASRLRPVTEDDLAKLDASLPRPPSFAAALQRSDGKLAVIAEIKRRSPSAGAIREGISATEQALRYQAAGASALSVLTDEKFFGGSLDDLHAVTAQFREKTPALPCLRKDFMVHPVQIAEAREVGASAILIIVRALNDEEIDVLFTHARAAGLDSLFEIHNEAELERALHHGAKIIGVNNRDLSIFKTDLSLSERLIPKFPRAVIAVSESGIFNGTDAARVHEAGAHAVLVGEALMKASDPAQLIADFRR
jgi:indole-3-glycerol phosphate synthase